MLRAIRQVYLTDRFFWTLSVLIGIFVLGFPFPLFFIVGKALLIVLLGVVMLEFYLLFRGKIKIDCKRIVPKLLNLGDENTIRIHLEHLGDIPFVLRILDEVPIQFQIRDFDKKLNLKPRQTEVLSYPLRPNKRGRYTFGATHLFVSTWIKLLERRISVGEEGQEVAVYPSVLQMKNMELMAFQRTNLEGGIKKIRRIGHSYEFEQIKNYVRGDDYRSINWKASSRKGNLMVNQYEDERAQQVYCVIDKSRVMRMPFEGLSLVDYAINSTLVLSNIILKKHDKAGLITFSDKLGSTIKADTKVTQLNKILEALYKEKERPLEANYELLYYASRKLISGRSLLLLFTNFESNYALDRVLPILRKINRIHLLVVVFFENTEIKSFAEEPAKDLEGIYYKTVAEKFLAEKQQMVHKLRQYGIQSVLTKPEELSINSVNKYLELKSRGLI